MRSHRFRTCVLWLYSPCLCCLDGSNLCPDPGVIVPPALQKKLASGTFFSPSLHTHWGFFKVATLKVTTDKLCSPGSHLSPSSLSQTRKNSRLQFNKVKVEDAGEYVCEAENILGKDTVRGRLHVNSGRCPSRKRRVLGDLAHSRSAAPRPSGDEHMICLALNLPSLPLLHIKPKISAESEKCSQSINV